MPRQTASACSRRGGDAIPSSTFTGGGGGGGGGTAFDVGGVTTDGVDAGQSGNGIVTFTYTEDPGCAPVPPPIEPPPPVAQPADVVQTQPAFTG